MRLQTRRMLAEWVLAEWVSIRGLLQFKWLQAGLLQINKCAVQIQPCGRRFDGLYWIRISDPSAERFIKLVRQFTDMTELTTEIAATLIEKILISQSEKVDGQQRQGVRIVYNFIGDVSEDIAE